MYLPGAASIKLFTRLKFMVARAFNFLQPRRCVARTQSELHNSLNIKKVPVIILTSVPLTICHTA